MSFVFFTDRDLGRLLMWASAGLVIPLTSTAAAQASPRPREDLDRLYHGE